MEEDNVANRLFLSEIQNSVYVGNNYIVEAVGNLIVSHEVIRESPRIESVKGYMSFMAHDILNQEMGNVGVITEFDLREPAKRICHQILKVGDTINVDNEQVIIDQFIGDPVICDYTSSLLYFVFRCGMNNSKKGCSIGCFIDKTSFNIKEAHFLSMNGRVLKNMKTPHVIWSNTRILKHNNIYYRSFRSYDDNKISIAKSLDLVNWETWIDISDVMSFVRDSNMNGFDETDIAIDEKNNVLYFATRNTSVVMGKVQMGENPKITQMSSVSDISPTRPSLALFNNKLYLFCNTLKNGSTSKQVNRTLVVRCYPCLIEMDTDFRVRKKLFGYSCIGGNYQVLYAYGSQLLCGLNFNKQGLSNTGSLERCGVYFTSLYSLANDN